MDVTLEYINAGIHVILVFVGINLGVNVFRLWRGN